MPMPKDSGWVAHIKRFMLEDGPGIRTVVFLQGCDLRCRWCSSPSTWSRTPSLLYSAKKCIGCGRCADVCHVGAISQNQQRIDRGKCDNCGACAANCPSEALHMSSKLCTPDEVMAEIRRDEDYYLASGGGVTLSGGEVSLQPDFAAGILRRCKDSLIHTAVESAGHAEWEYMEKWLPYTDLLFFDIKHVHPVLHKKLTGQPNELILENLRKTVKSGRCRVILNLPLIPGCNDDEQNLLLYAGLMDELRLDTVRLLPYHRLGLHEYEQLGMEGSALNVLNISPPAGSQLQKVRDFFEQRQIITL